MFACGDVTGFAGTAAAARAGAAAGRALASTLADAGVLVARSRPRCSAPAARRPRRRPRGRARRGGGRARRPTRSSRRRSRAARPRRPRAPPTRARRAPRDPGRRLADRARQALRQDAGRRRLERRARQVRAARARARRPTPRSIASLNQMIGELGQSHMLIVGPGAEDDDDAERCARSRSAPRGRHRRDRRSRPDRARDRRTADDHARARRLVGRHAPAWRAGYVVTQIAGRPLGAPRDSARPLRPVEERFAIRRAAQHRLQGPPGTRVSIAYLDDHDRAGQRRAGPRSAARDAGAASATCRRSTPRCAPTRSAPSASSLQRLPAAADPGGRQEGDGALRRPPRPRGRARSARQPGRPGRDGDPDRVAVRHRADDAGDAAVPRLRPDVHGAARDGRGPVHRPARDPDRRGERVGGGDPRGRAAGVEARRSSSATRRWARCCRR